MTHGGDKGMLSTQTNPLDVSSQLYRHVHGQDTIVHAVGYALLAALHRFVRTVAPPTTSLTLHMQ